MEVFGYIASVFIGITLGLAGSGGSILAVPVLVYLFHISPDKATGYSLFIVGTTALAGAAKYYKMGLLHLKPALFFTIFSAVSVLLVRRLLLPVIPGVLFTAGNFSITKNLLTMIVFAVLMIAAAISMIKKNDKHTGNTEISNIKLAVTGFAVGMITGFLGAGGGFLIIPSLVFFAKMEMKKAVGTSLLIIAVNSFTGFAGDLTKGAGIHFGFLLVITAIAILGMFIGTYLSKKIDGKKLKPAFGWFVLTMGIYIIIKELFLK